MGKVMFLDVAEKELFTYLFETRQGRYELRDSRKSPLPEKYDFPPEALAEDCEDVYLSLPVSMLNFRVIELPFSDRDRIRGVLPFELDGMTLGGSDKIVCDDIIIGSSDGKSQVLVVYIEKNIIRDILAKLKSNNRDPVFITCLELRNILQDFSPDKLLSSPPLDERVRIKLAGEEIKGPSIDLRKEEFAFTRDIEKTKKSLRVSAALIVSIALVISAGLLMKITTTKSEIGAVKNEMRKRYQAMFPQEKNIMNELYQLKSHMKEMRSREDVLVGVKPLDTLLKLSQLDRQSVVFHEITTDRDRLTVKGDAPSLSDVQQIKDKMGTLFDEVNIADSKSSAEGKMSFTITAKEKKT
jgi:type II secretory pathway component PulL